MSSIGTLSSPPPPLNPSVQSFEERRFQFLHNNGLRGRRTRNPLKSSASDPYPSPKSIQRSPHKSIDDTIDEYHDANDGDDDEKGDETQNYITPPPSPKYTTNEILKLNPFKSNPSDLPSNNGDGGILKKPSLAELGILASKNNSKNIQNPFSKSLNGSSNPSKSRTSVEQSLISRKEQERSKTNGGGDGPKTLEAKDLIPTGSGGLCQMLKDLKSLRKKQRQQRELRKEELEQECKEKGDLPYEEKAKNILRMFQESEFATMVDEDLRSKIFRQIEYYFGDYNLPRDKFLLDLIDKSHGGWISMDTMLTFPRLAKLTSDIDLILDTLVRNSDLIECDFTRKMIRRSPIYPIPANDDERRLDLQERTLFVGGFLKGDELTLDDLLEHFEQGYKGLKNIRMRTNSDKYFIGSCFFTFDRIERAEQFLKDRKWHEYKGRKLIVRWQRDFFKRRVEFNDTLDLETLDRTIFVHGFDRVEMSSDEMTGYFEKFAGVQNIKMRCFKNLQEGNEWQFSGSVFVTFDNAINAERFLKNKGRLSYFGDKLMIQTQEQYYVEKKKFTKELQSRGK